jgi:hypothetical protein
MSDMDALLLEGEAMNNRQLTVLTGNSVPEVGRVFSLLSESGLDVRAHCLVDNGEINCKLRLIVSDPQRAAEVLQAHHFTTVFNDVLIVETDDKPGGLSRILKCLDSSQIQIAYTYTAASETSGTAIMVFRFSDNQNAGSILERNGIRVVKSGGASAAQRQK